MRYGRSANAGKARPALIVAIAVMLAGVVTDLVSGSGADHAGVMGIPGFWSVFALLGCFALVGAAKLAAYLLLKRPENYYDDTL